MSRSTSAPTALLSRLAAPLRDRLREVVHDARDPLGEPRDYQHVFDLHIRLFDELTAAGIDHRQLAALLAEIGVQRGDGEPLSRGTVSSGLSRARERMAAQDTTAAALSRRSRGGPQQDEGSRSRLQQIAADCSRLPDAASSGPAPSSPAIPRRNQQQQGMRAQEKRDSAASREHPNAGGRLRDESGDTPAAVNQAAASILNQLRSNQCR